MVCFGRVQCMCWYCFVFIPFLYLTNVDVAKYWPSIIFFKFYSDFWLTSSIDAISTPLTYFYLLCFSLTLRIKELSRKLDLLNGRAADMRTLKALLIEHNAICMTITVYDRFWSKYILFSYITYFPLMSLMAYITLINEVIWYLRGVFMVIFSEFFLLVTFTCLSARHVSSLVSCNLAQISFNT